MKLPRSVPPLLVPYALAERSGDRRVMPADGKEDRYYRCCECNRQVHTRKIGDDRRHFFHKHDPEARPCALEGKGALETQEHVLAKHHVYLTLQQTLLDPPPNENFFVERACGRCGAVHNDPFSLTLRAKGAARVQVEARAADPIATQYVPDVAVYDAEDKPLLFVEIKKSHAVPEKKAAELTVPWFELRAVEVIDDARMWKPFRDGPTTADPVACSCRAPGLTILTIGETAPGRVECAWRGAAVPVLEDAGCATCAHRRDLAPVPGQPLISPPTKLACAVPADLIAKAADERWRAALRAEAAATRADANDLLHSLARNAPFVATAPLCFVPYLLQLRRAIVDAAAADRRRAALRAEAAATTNYALLVIRSLTARAALVVTAPRSFLPYVLMFLRKVDVAARKARRREALRAGATETTTMANNLLHYFTVNDPLVCTAAQRFRPWLVVLRREAAGTVRASLVAELERLEARQAPYVAGLRSTRRLNISNDHVIDCPKPAGRSRTRSIDDPLGCMHCSYAHAFRAESKDHPYTSVYCGWAANRTAPQLPATNARYVTTADLDRATERKARIAEIRRLLSSQPGAQGARPAPTAPRPTRPTRPPRVDATTAASPEQVYLDAVDPDDPWS